MLPLFTICDRWDVGGVSMAIHPQTGQPTIFVYDGYPGGAGIAELAFEAASRHARATLELIAACPCDDGCPSCVQSPKCGNWNEYLDKAGRDRVARGHGTRALRAARCTAPEPVTGRPRRVRGRERRRARPSRPRPRRDTRTTRAPRRSRPRPGAPPPPRRHPTGRASTSAAASAAASAAVSARAWLHGGAAEPRDREAAQRGESRPPRP